MLLQGNLNVLFYQCNNPDSVVKNNIQLLDEAEQNIVIYQWRADQLFADAEGRGK